MPFDRVVALENRIGSGLALAAIAKTPAPLVAGRYRASSLLGRGARGVVFSARDEELGRVVAVKLCPCSVSTDVEDVRAEARMLARLSHPNVVGVYDTGKTTVDTAAGPVECFFVCMELVRGENMRNWIQRLPSKRELFRVLADAAEGLLAAHEAGVVHSDFKPENVVIGEDGAVQVVDFGLARVDPTAFGEFVMRHEGGDVGGTVGYMAPEIVSGAPADPRSDQFSLAVTLVEAVSTASIGAAVGPQLAIKLGLERLPRRLRRAAEKALRADPMRRHESLRPILSRLRAASKAPLVRYRWPLAVSGAVLVGAIGAGVAMTYSRPPDESRADPNSRPIESGADDGAAELVVATPDNGETETETLTSVPTAGTASAKACPSNKFVGDWVLLSEVTWAQRESLRRASGEYQLHISSDGACATQGKLVKVAYGDRRREAGRVSISRRRSTHIEGDSPMTLDENGRLRGEFSMSGSARAHMTLELEARPGGLVGVWHRRNTVGGWESRGTIASIDSSRTAPSVQHDTLSCESRCSLACGGQSSTTDCQAACNNGLDGKACRAPGSAFEVAALRSNIGGAETSAEVCEQLSPFIGGSWVVRAQGGDTEMSLRVGPDCRIAGTMKRSGVHRQVGGDFLWAKPLGVWRIWDGETQWYFTGWGPAFGMSSTGIAVAAYKESPV